MILMIPAPSPPDEEPPAEDLLFFSGAPTSVPLKMHLSSTCFFAAFECPISSNESVASLPVPAHRTRYFIMIMIQSKEANAANKKHTPLSCRVYDTLHQNANAHTCTLTDESVEIKI